MRHVVLYALAGITAAEIAEVFQSLNVAGSAWQGFGFGSWGIEPTTFVLIATDDVRQVDNYMKGILKGKDQECAFRVLDGVAGLLYSA